jgi:hypothetical protein
MATLGRGAFALAFGVLALSPRPASAETLLLDNGDRISGRILSRDESVVRIETPFGQLRVPRSRIVRLIGAGDTPAPRGAAAAPEGRILLDLTIVGQAFWQARESVQLRSQDNTLRFELRLDGALLAAYEDYTLDPGEIRRAAVNVFSFRPREARAISAKGVKLSPAASHPGRVTLQLTLPPATAGRRRLTVSYLGGSSADGTREVLSFAALDLLLREGTPCRLSLSQRRGEMEFAGWPRRRMRGIDTFALSLRELTD